MPHTPPDVVLAYAQTANGVGLAVGIGGSAIRYANAPAGSTTRLNQNKYPICAKIRVSLQDSAAGGNAAVAVQTSPDNVTYTTVYTFPAAQLTVPANLIVSKAKLFKFPSGTLFVRTNMSGITGGTTPTLNAYLTLDRFGI